MPARRSSSIKAKSKARSTPVKTNKVVFVGEDVTDIIVDNKSVKRKPEDDDLADEDQEALDVSFTRLMLVAC